MKPAEWICWLFGHKVKVIRKEYDVITICPRCEKVIFDIVRFSSVEKGEDGFHDQVSGRYNS